MKFRISLLFCNFLLICSIPAYAALADITRIFHETPTLSHLDVCQGGGCAEVDQISISETEWASVEKLFQIKATSAAEERQQISQAIGLVEQIVGVKNGTSGDRAGTFGNSATAGQLDCNDEAINTTTYMRLLKSHGLMQLHDIDDIHTRNFFFTGWPHSAAAIHEIKTGEKFAVDSWFYDNGHSATIVPFALWKAGYKPDDSPIGKSKPTKLASPEDNKL
jgi:hypothetical protein